MRKTEQSRETYNKKAANYDNTYDGRVTQPLKQLLLNTIKVQPNQTVLDVACGTGSLIAAISKKADIHAYGIDIAEEMIKIANETHDNISFAVAPAYPLKFDSSSFDTIVVSAAFHHFENPNAFVTECFRVLKPGGKVYIGEFCIPAFFRIIANAIFPFLKTGDVKLYSETELSSIFTKAVFTTKNVQSKGRCMVLVFEKS